MNQTNIQIEQIVKDSWIYSQEGLSIITLGSKSIVLRLVIYNQMIAKIITSKIFGLRKILMKSTLEEIILMVKQY